MIVKESFPNIQGTDTWSPFYKNKMFKRIEKKSEDFQTYFMSLVCMDLVLRHKNDCTVQGSKNVGKSHL